MIALVYISIKSYSNRHLISIWYLPLLHEQFESSKFEALESHNRYFQTYGLKKLSKESSFYGPKSDSK